MHKLIISAPFGNYISIPGVTSTIGTLNFPINDIISSQIYCDYLEENQYINLCLREELKREFEEKQIYTIPDNDEEDEYGDEYGYGDGDGTGIGDGYGDGFGYGYWNGNGVGNGFEYGYGDGDGYGNGYGNGGGNGYRYESG